MGRRVTTPRISSSAVHGWATYVGRDTRIVVYTEMITIDVLRPNYIYKFEENCTHRHHTPHVMALLICALVTPGLICDLVIFHVNIDEFGKSRKSKYKFLSTVKTAMAGWLSFVQFIYFFLSGPNGSLMMPFRSNAATAKKQREKEGRWRGWWKEGHRQRCRGAGNEKIKKINNNRHYRKRHWIWFMKCITVLVKHIITSAFLMLWCHHNVKWPKWHLSGFFFGVELWKHRLPAPFDTT